MSVIPITSHISLDSNMLFHGSQIRVQVQFKYSQTSSLLEPSHISFPNQSTTLHRDPVLGSSQWNLGMIGPVHLQIPHGLCCFSAQKPAIASCYQYSIKTPGPLSPTSWEITLPTFLFYVPLALQHTVLSFPLILTSLV